ncbi:MAG: hypothetical protein ACOCV2_11245, partial [Persicimonas sp.]
RRAMTDPISGQAASQMTEQVSRADEARVGAEDGPDETAEASFDEVMGEVQTDGVDNAEQVDQVEGVEETQQSEGPAQQRLRSFVDEMSADEAEIEQMMEGSLEGGDMSQKEMLQMQSLIYGYSQKVELTTKAVSSATDGMKQVMNTQV